MFENSREPIALHWPVIELAPVPGRPMLPVMSARLMIACAVFTPWWLWLTPIVHQNETRDRSWIRAAASRIDAGAQSGLGGHPLHVESARRKSANSSKPLVCASMNGRSIQPFWISRLARP